jgi:hypothetical protein
MLLISQWFKDGGSEQFFSQSLLFIHNFAYRILIYLHLTTNHPTIEDFHRKMRYIYFGDIEKNLIY